MYKDKLRKGIYVVRNVRVKAKIIQIGKFILLVNEKRENGYGMSFIRQLNIMDIEIVKLIGYQ